MAVELPLRGKYLRHQVKKVAKKGSGNTGSDDKRYKAPKLIYPEQPTRVRVLTLTASGKRSWR
jgi:hypothetical protein